MKMRQATVQTFLRSGKTRTQNESIVPIIQLRGKWLSEANFDPGTKANVIVEKNKIIIER